MGQAAQQVFGRSGQAGAAIVTTLAAEKQSARDWFEALQERICGAFEDLERQAPPHLYPGDPGRFETTPWSRTPARDGADQGGGSMRMMRGRLFAKVGVHTSTVFGELPPDFAAQIKGAAADRRFWASGISLIAHMHNPRVPAVHMNTRFIVTGESWFGGGADLNPTIDEQRREVHEDAREFHARLRSACDSFDPAWYERYRAWADEYFWLPHRSEPRGVGGIFFDHHNTGDHQRDFTFAKAVGEAFLDIYPTLVRRRMVEPWNAQDLAEQAKWRSRYVEFNLLYDRGTQFGLKTGGNVESILSSLPPTAEWP